MKRPYCAAALLPILVSVFLTGCSPRAQATPTEPEAPAGPVAGLIRGTAVELPGAEFDGKLSIFAGEGWGFNPSLLFFLFLERGEIPAGRTIVVDPKDAMNDDTPHVHYRWFDATGNIDTDAAIEGYSLRLTFGELENGALPGTIEFEVPGEGTRVAGSFVAALR